MADYPFLTADLPGVGGAIKQRLEDFQVEELSLPAEVGPCLHVRLTKRGISTPVAIGRLARFLEVPAGAIGYAGMKDSQAVTTQTISLDSPDRRRLAAFHDSQMQSEVLGPGRRLRPGDSAGNRFRVLVRGVEAGAERAAQAVLDVLLRRGVPAYFGSQRFGGRGDNVELGLELLRGQLQEFVELYLGRARPGDDPEEKSARDAFDTGFLDRALQLWPRRCQQQRRVLMAYRQAQRRPGPAISAVDKNARRLYISAVQSEVFNQVLARRIQTLDKFLQGDIAIDEKGDLTVVDDPVAFSRSTGVSPVAMFSPTGPIVGYIVGLAGGEAGQIEQEVFTPYGLDLAAFRRFDAKGTRRPLRFALSHAALAAGSDRLGRFLELRFDAPPGCYATTVLGEVMKNEPVTAE